ncbi:GntR family transcriptional regulator [Orrella daihaiensis]|uniref:GntR family transcriptional regulator n=1 Tax=Orrella daihaiensis TaxID=2782176 RepID=A0ABY4AHX2_9BURK|nr:GntR family transcriptional regulator [Orrella daihaiensis]UOD49518.1 GntR family transcriptional regulator [Orrella daihaiensis]
MKDIQTGKYPVGGQFPTEEQIASTYQVSRHTVREATRRLSETGLISRRRSTGTIVTATHPTDKSYVAALGSMKELMDYTMSTQLEVFGQMTIDASDELAQTLGCEPSSKWVMLKTFRKVLNEPEPISYTEVYLRPEFEDIAKHLHGRHPSILELHRRLFDDPVHSVVQRIEAMKMPRKAAQALGLTSNDPTLKMTRIYEDKNGRVMSASQNFYVAQRFELITRWSETGETVL